MPFERARRTSTRSLVAVSVSLVALLGLVRPAVSETTRTLCPIAPVASSRASARVERATVAIAARDTALPDGRRDADEISLVPAAFAWDPDVRFLYFRHVSKWM